MLSKSRKRVVFVLLFKYISIRSIEPFWHSCCFLNRRIYFEVIMKSKIYLLLLILGIATILLSGCHTQLRTTRNLDDYDQEESVSSQRDYESEDDAVQDDSDEESYTNEESSSGYSSGYNDSWHSNWGFSYYYPQSYWPSSAYMTAWNDPWMYDRYWSYYPNYSYHSYSSYPWYCGTPYIGYPYYYSNWGNWGYPYYEYRRYQADRYVRGPRTTGTERGRLTRDGYQSTEYSPYPAGSVNVPSSGASVGNRGGARTETINTTKKAARKQGENRGTSVERRRSTNGNSQRGTRAPSYTPTYRGRSSEQSSESGRSSTPSTPSYTPPASSSTSPPPSTNSAPRESSRPAPSSSGSNSRGPRK